MQGVDVGKDRQFNLRLSDEEYEALERLSSHGGTTAAQVIRALIKREVEAVAATRDDHRLVLHMIERLYKVEMKPVPLRSLIGPAFERDAEALLALWPRGRLTNGIAPVLDDLVRWHHLRLVGGREAAYMPTWKALSV